MTEKSATIGNMAITRKKTTVYLDPELLRAVKVVAASSGRHDYEVLEDAVHQYLHTGQAEASRQELCELLDQLGGPDALSDEEALKLAYDELHAARPARRQD
jgi:hypothetical protein